MTQSIDSSAGDATTTTTTTFNGGIVLFAGGTDYENITKRATTTTKAAKGKGEAVNERAEMYPDLLTPHRFASLEQVAVRLIATGPAAAHAWAIDVAGQAYGWGRNSEGQLGLADRIQRNQPTRVDDLVDIVAVGCGRAHSVLVQSDGTSLSCGDNKYGQLGQNSDIAGCDTPGRVALTKSARFATCGADFSIWLTTDGNLFAAGSGENGTLGDGSTHMYNARTSSIKMEVEPVLKPQPVLGLPKDAVVNVAAGVSHCVAITSNGQVYSWGLGDYGRLGHSVQQDELRPRPISQFTGSRSVPPDSLVACGGAYSMVSSQHGIYWWGKVKQAGDALMEPQMCYDLRGWIVRAISCGKTTFGVAAEKSCILWGNAIHGELAGGQHGKKSSAAPAKCHPLEGLETHSVQCANGFTVFLMDTNDAKTAAVCEQLDVYEAPEKDPLTSAGASPAKAKNAKTPTKKAPPAKKRKRASD